MRPKYIKYWSPILAFIMMIVMTSCDEKNAEVTEYNIIPEPAYMVQKARSFSFSSRTKLYFENLAQNSSTTKFITNTLRKMHIRPAFIGTPNRGSITITLNDTINPSLGEEGYLLQVLPDGIFISANTEAGLIYAFETFIQMLPEDLHQQPHNHITLPECTILDYPRFPWRGSHLDVCRHFIPVKQIKRHLDIMAAHKLNKFHWHLSDDQGWRIEIEKYPELNDVGSWRADRSGVPWGEEEPARPGEESTYGGFYTKADIAEIVQYAQDRNIEVIPEIDIPAHASAILAAHPEFSCDHATYTVALGPCWPHKATLCAGNDDVIRFIDDILDEIALLFPSEFIHIGIDNINTENWENCPKCQSRIRHEGLADEVGLLNWLVTHIEEHLSRKGKRIIGWDEILICNNLSSEAAIMATMGDSTIHRGTIRGLGVINANAEYCDLDSYQADTAFHLMAFPQYLPLSKCYQFDPMPKSLTSDLQPYCWGGEAVLWTGYIANYEQAEYFLLPRLCALAECFWSLPENKSWSHFQTKIEHQKKRMRCFGYKPCKGSFKPTVIKTHTEDDYLVTLSTEVAGTYVYYTTDGSDPTPECSIYTGPIRLPKGTRLRTLSFYNGQAQEGIYDFIL
ncbi:MAG: family 20 glycosylhydrolase [Bacteroidales bacterium]|nr:family 20 glycosylhydrolase [Bacteroidales bacterium]